LRLSRLNRLYGDPLPEISVWHQATWHVERDSMGLHLSDARAEVVATFSSIYHREPEGVWVAPGRVNLIGEHTDYSGGLVLPMALPQVCMVAAASRDDGVFSVCSRQQSGAQINSTVTALPGQVQGWAAYAVGIAWALREAGHLIGGVDVVLDSTVPIGAGLSSSAAIGCSVASALRDLFDLPLDGLELAAIARRCENEFAGAPTGVMDQAVSMMAREGHLFSLDTRSMAIEHVPFALDNFGLTLLVMDTRTKHELNDGGYASRRKAVEDGARLLSVAELRDLDDVDLDAALARLDQTPGPESAMIVRRVRHVVTENARVRAVVEILKSGADPRQVGPILTAGHRSLRDDFEISTPELDTAVEAAEAAGAHGARMTGGGFGGSAIALIDTDAVDEVKAAVDRAYAERGFQPAAFFSAVPAAGARRLP
jgi:galactokinase